MDGLKIKHFPPEQRALITVAVLMDGREAQNYLENDKYHGKEFADAASELAAIVADIRTPLAGSLLRDALKELEARN